MKPNSWNRRIDFSLGKWRTLTRRFNWLMALIQCKECNEPVSTEANICPHCGALQKSVPPPLPTQPPFIEPKPSAAEEQIYADGIVTVTTARVTVGGTTYALRNITSVGMVSTPPRVAGAILLLIVGLLIAVAIFVRLNEPDKAPPGVYVMAGALIGGALFWMFKARTHFHVGLLTASGEVQVLTSKDKTYVERVVQSINEAIVRSHAKT